MFCPRVHPLKYLLGDLNIIFFPLCNRTLHIAVDIVTPGSNFTVNGPNHQLETTLFFQTGEILNHLGQILRVLGLVLSIQYIDQRKSPEYLRHHARAAIDSDVAYRHVLHPPQGPGLDWKYHKNRFEDR
jgi:hypothetical protein